MSRALRAFDTSDRLARHVTHQIVERLGSLIEDKGYAVFVTSAGRTPLPVYADLRRRHRHAIDWSRVHIAQMDDYADPAPPHATTFQAFLEREIVRPLGVGGFSGLRTESGRREMREIARRTGGVGGIDLILHGIGTNGHIGFNEPGAPRFAGLGTVRLSEATLSANFGPDRSAWPNGMGYTLGLATLARVPHSILIATGHIKRRAMAKLLDRVPASTCPATSLHACPRFDIYADRAALKEAQLAAL